MFTRVVDITSRPGTVHELSRLICDQVLPILKSFPGFVDEIILVSDQKPNHLIALSFWESKEDAERYCQEGSPRVNDLIRPIIEGIPRVETFGVEQSTAHRTDAGRAA
jgi:heme-degrading monooxygenase HmoA